MSVNFTQEVFTIRKLFDIAQTLKDRIIYWGPSLLYGDPFLGWKAHDTITKATGIGISSTVDRVEICISTPLEYKNYQKTKEALTDTISDELKGEMKKITNDDLYGDDGEIIGGKCAQLILGSLVKNEEKFTCVLTETVPPENRKKIVCGLLGVDECYFSQTNGGGQCWYLFKIYKLLKSLPETDVDDCKDKLVKLGYRAKPEVKQFLQDIMEIDGLSKDLEVVLNEVGVILPLAKVTHQYLMPSTSIKEKILLICLTEEINT